MAVIDGLGPEQSKTNQKMNQGPGFFGLPVGTKIPTDLESLAVSEIKFSDNSTGFQTTELATVRVETLLALLTTGVTPITLPALTNMLNDIQNEVKFESRQPLSDSIGESLNNPGQSFQIQKLKKKSGSMGQSSTDVERFYPHNMNIYTLTGDNTGEQLAKALTLAEAHREFWQDYGIDVNRLIAGGPYRRIAKPSAFSPAYTLPKLAQLTEPGEYSVRELFPQSEATSSKLFQQLEDQSQYLIARLNRVEDPESFSTETQPLFDYIRGNPGKVLFKESQLREFELLKEHGYYDGNPSAQLVLVEPLVSEVGRLNVYRLMADAIVSLQAEFELKIPLATLKDRYNELYLASIGIKEAKLFPVGDAFESVLAVVTQKKVINQAGAQIPYVLADISDQAIQFDKKIVLAEGIPLKTYRDLDDGQGRLGVAAEFRGRLIAAAKELKVKNTQLPDDRLLELPIAQAREIYSEIAKERGLPDDRSTIRLQTKDLLKQYDLTGEEPPKIIISADQLTTLKRIMTRLEQFAERYQWLVTAGPDGGQGFIKNVFGEDLVKGDRVSVQELPEPRRRLLLALIKEYEQVMSLHEV